MRTILCIALLLIAAAPARANIRESDSSYYNRIAQSCLYTVRETWRDYLLYVPTKRTDECCASSVRMMKSTGAREKSGDCPQGTQENSLRCTTSKTWCEAIQR
jgi:hypothetical protein